MRSPVPPLALAQGSGGPAKRAAMRQGRGRLGALLLTLGTLSACQFAQVEGNTAGSRTLRVAVIQDTMPFGSIGPGMKAYGLDIDVANALARQIGAKIILVPVTGANRISYLQSGKVDMIVAALGKSPAREKAVAYSRDPYVVPFNGVYGDIKVPAHDLAGLVDHSVSVPGGGTEDLELTDVAKPGTIIRRFQDTAGMLSSFTAGQAEMFVTDNTAAASFARSVRRPFNLKFKLEDEPLYVGVRKHDVALLAEVNGALAKLRADGSLKALAVRWIGPEGRVDIAGKKATS